MAGQLDIPRTPTKLSHLVNVSPKTKGSICVICGECIVNSARRRKLFNRDHKTEICQLIENTLHVSILRECSTHTVCRKCSSEVTRLVESKERLIKAFKETSISLYQSHGHSVEKRLRSEEESQTKEARRRSLFPESSVVTGDSTFGTRPIGTQGINKNEVTISTRNGILRTVQQPLATLALATTTTDFKYLSTLILQSEELTPFIINGVCHKIQNEVINLCSKREPSILRGTDVSSLKGLSWTSIAEEFRTRAPTYWSVLQVFSSNPSSQKNKSKTDKASLPGLVSAGSKLLSIYNRDLNRLQHLNSIILLKGGAKKSAFNRLNVTNDSTCYTTAVTDIEQLSKDWDAKITEWKTTCETDCQREQHLIQNVVEAETYISENGQTPFAVLSLDQEENILATHRKEMHPGYYLVGDNVDFYTKVRHMTSTHQNKSTHMYQICAYKNKVSGNHLDDSKPKNDVQKIELSCLLPSEEEQSVLLAFLVAHIWIRYIPCFKMFEKVLPSFIKHKYMKEMQKKTERINLGVLQKNEQYNDQMIDICEFMQQFVPEVDNCNKKHPKILSGGDYLTFERHKEAQTGKANGRTPSEKLHGLVPKLEEFHNQAEFLKLIWNSLYDTTSFDSIGTLFAARNKLNARNVPKDPHNHFYASADFIDKVTDAYVIAGGLKHFEMDSLHDRLKPQMEYSGPVGDTEAMKEFILKHAHQFVENHGSPRIPKLPDYGPQSLTLECRYCQKTYKRTKSLRQHEAKVHSHADPEFNPDNIKEAKEKTHSKSSVYDYTRLCVTLGLLRKNHDDAIKFGDGERMIRLAKFFCLLYKGGKCPKYAFGLLETIAQVETLLSERQAERLIWNRTVNHAGKMDTNHPNDLDLEHCNKVFKEDVHTYRGQYTERTILRVSRSALVTEDICKDFDSVSKVKQSSGRHTKTDATDDILSLAEQLHVQGNVFDTNRCRTHQNFINLKDPLKSLNMENVQHWIAESLKVFKKKKYYH